MESSQAQALKSWMQTVTTAVKWIEIAVVFVGALVWMLWNPTLTKAQITAQYPWDNVLANAIKDPNTGANLLQVLTSDWQAFPYDRQTNPNAAVWMIGNNWPVYVIDNEFGLGDGSANIPIEQLKNHLQTWQTVMATLIINNIEYKFQLTKDSNGNLVVWNIILNGGAGPLSNFSLLSNLPTFTTTVTDADCGTDGKVIVTVGNVESGDVPLDPDMFAIGDSLLLVNTNVSPNKPYYGKIINMDPLQVEVDGLKPWTYHFKVLLSSGYSQQLLSSTIASHNALLNYANPSVNDNIAENPSQWIYADSSIVSCGPYTEEVSIQCPVPAWSSVYLGNGLLMTPDADWSYILPAWETLQLTFLKQDEQRTVPRSIVLGDCDKSWNITIPALTPPPTPSAELESDLTNQIDTLYVVMLPWHTYTATVNNTQIQLGTDGKATIPWTSEPQAVEVSVSRGANGQTIDGLWSRTWITNFYTSTSSPESTTPHVTVFPNPARDVIRLQWIENLNIESVKIRDMTGRVMYNQNGDGLWWKLSQYWLGVSLLPSGVYIGTVFTVDWKEIKFRFMVNK